jgi:AcrR family transcriptional regulator
MPRPRALTPAQLAAATLEAIERGGLDALSMRAVALELGMGVMSLYRYVESREGLEILVVDHVLAKVDVRVPRYRDWKKRVQALGERIRVAPAAANWLAFRWSLRVFFRSSGACCARHPTHVVDERNCRARSPLP